jgi:hypothetical protein
MRIGTAFGRIIELGGAACATSALGGHDYVHDGIYFDGASMDRAIARYDRRGVFELKDEKVYGDVRVVAKADHFVGAVLTETKTTFKAFDAEKYAASYQWRMMADIFEPSAVIYRVALLDEDRKTPGRYLVDDVIDLPLYPYPGLHDDCAAWVAAARSYVVHRNLVSALMVRDAEKEATA